MSHLVDPQTVRNIELGMMEEKIRNEWDLDKSFKLVDKRNSEIYMVMRELEEIAWRASSVFNEREFKGIKEMVSVDRNWKAFDKEFYKTDMESMEHFFNMANGFDDRMRLIENWICRKETEYQTRVNLPTADL